MRRLLISLAGLVLLSSALGCCICGKCDCTPYVPCAGGTCIGYDHPAPAPGGQVIQAEPLKPPKGGGDEQ
jgi:hypothetical protein